MFKKFIHSPHLSLFAGLVLLSTAGYEIWDSYGAAKMGAHHGMFFYGLVHIAKSVPEFKDGIKEIAEVVK